ncbi:MAG TPA: hypothetical protein VKU77_10295 [Streptosporangiaceae bacterium]|nr:hypothetical protein [Streptosporangiaceae bacterium]
MTQDPYGQQPGSGYVVRGEVVPDDEADVTQPAGPMTHFQKVASALRGDKTDPAVPVAWPADQDGPPSPDPNGTWPGAGSETGPAPVHDADAADAAQPEDVGAVRSPDGGRDYWDEADEADRHGTVRDDAVRDDAVRDGAAGSADAEGVPAGHEGAPTAEADAVTMQTRPDEQDPTMTQPDLHAATAHPATDTVEPGAAEPGAVEAGLAEPEEVGPGAVEPGAVEPGAAEPGAVGRHAGVPAQEGLRPGESDSGLGDFSDLTYGSLLPDAAEFKSQWQQVQFRFVDDPQGSVTEAADVISRVTAKLEAAIAERQRAIAERQRALRNRWSEGKSTDTESLRETLLMYRTFLDQLTGPKGG